MCGIPVGQTYAILQVDRTKIFSSLQKMGSHAFVSLLGLGAWELRFLASERHMITWKDVCLRWMFPGPHGGNLAVLCRRPCPSWSCGGNLHYALFLSLLFSCTVS